MLLYTCLKIAVISYNSVGAWPVDPGGRAFRHFRIRQHGPNNAGKNYLMCCGFEVYGELHEAAA